METQHWISEALECGYISQEDAAELTAGLIEIGCMLNGMIEKSDAFCRQPPFALKEDAGDYFTPTDD